MKNDSCTYGNRSDQIHPFFKAKREWSKVKDKILGDYIECYLKTVQRRNRPIIIIDAFSGPGKFGDNTEGSPLITCRAIEKWVHGGGIGCIFSDANASHRRALENCLKDYIQRGIAEKPLPDFPIALSRALEIGKGATLFFYLDPYGIKGLEFQTVRQIYERDKDQSTEVLINFSFKAFMRMSGNWSYSDSASKVADKVKKSKIETVDNVMGGNYWLGIVTDPNLDKIQREDAIVNAYMDRIRQFFHYTYSIPVKQVDEAGDFPADDLAKYHLIFGTRSPKAVVYMNDVALNALEPYLQQFKDGLLFDMTPERYESCSVGEVKSAIVEIVKGQQLTRPQIYDAIIPKYFMQRRKKEYRAIIDELTFGEKRLFPDRNTMKRPSQLNDQTLLSTKRDQSI